MDGERLVDETSVSVGEEIPAEQCAVVEATSTVYLGRWNRLVSTTNWEKGRIVAEWRTALIEAGAPPSSYTDEAWSQLLGNVSPQHTGRLRRVYQRFGAVHEANPTLYWSHFQAALDWNDAEMWLEGAVQNAWSISEMQAQRSSTLGAIEEPALAPAAELDEDTAADLGPGPQDAFAGLDEDPAASGSPPVEWDESPTATEHVLPESAEELADALPPIRPFKNLSPLPSDLGDAVEAFKLGILRQRVSKWQEVSCAEVVAALEALRQLAEAPIEA